MESDIFKAGVALGAPASEDEIKMLLCYILCNIDGTMSFAQLYEALSENNLINYFELVRILEKLVELGHIESIAPASDEPDAYAATELGRNAAAEFERALPLSVREKALNSSRLVLERAQRLRELRIEQAACDGGYQLTLSIPDAEGTLMLFQVFAPTEQQCRLMKKRFLNAPLTIYQGVLALLTGDDKTLDKLFARETPLF